MKKIILSLVGATIVCTAFAANCVSVRQISTNYASHQITIALTRSGCTGDNTNHRNTAWVFVDYRTVTGTVKGAWTRATVGATSAGTVVNSGSSKGAWITGANGTQTVTLTLSGMPAKYDWCAIATDYPPNIVASGGVYTFKGTPPFVLQPTTGSAQTVTQTTLAATSLAVAPVFIRDATGCTGTFCPYTGTDLYMDATHACRVRADGAKNWEAWIRDARDGQAYRIIQSNNGWMFADRLNTTVAGTVCSGVRLYGYPDNKTALCPAGWILPSKAQFVAFGSSRADYQTYYGFSHQFNPTNYAYARNACSTNGYTHILVSDCGSSYAYVYGNYTGGTFSGCEAFYRSPAHCFRVL